MVREANGNYGIILYSCKHGMLRKTRYDVNMLADASSGHHIP